VKKNVRAERKERRKEGMRKGEDGRRE